MTAVGRVVHFQAHLLEGVGQVIHPGLGRGGGGAQQGDRVRRHAGLAYVLQEGNQQLSQTGQPFVHDNDHVIVGGQGAPQCREALGRLEGVAYGAARVGQGWRRRLPAHADELAVADLHLEVLPAVGYVDPHGHSSSRGP